MTIWVVTCRVSGEVQWVGPGRCAWDLSVDTDQHVTVLAALVVAPTAVAALTTGLVAIDAGGVATIAADLHLDVRINDRQYTDPARSYVRARPPTPTSEG